jgi:hypothetical protein
MASVRRTATPRSSPTLPSSPLPRVRENGLRGSRVRTSYVCLAAFTLNPAAVDACPPTRFRSSGYHGTAGRADLQAGHSEQRGGLTLPVTDLAIVRPRLTRVGGASNRAQPPVASRRPQHRPAPHTSQGYRFTLSRGGDSHPLSLAQPLRFTLDPRDPVRVAQRLALDSSRWSAVEPRAEPPERRVWCRASQDFPRHAAHPAEREGWQPPTPTSGPGVTQVGSGAVYHTPRRVAHKEPPYRLLHPNPSPAKKVKIDTHPTHPLHWSSNGPPQPPHTTPHRANKRAPHRAPHCAPRTVHV